MNVTVDSRRKVKANASTLMRLCFFLITRSSKYVSAVISLRILKNANVFHHRHVSTVRLILLRVYNGVVMEFSPSKLQVHGSNPGQACHRLTNEMLQVEIVFQIHSYTFMRLRSKEIVEFISISGSQLSSLTYLLRRYD